jgi:hypothetical protein
VVRPRPSPGDAEEGIGLPPAGRAAVDEIISTRCERHDACSFRHPGLVAEGFLQEPRSSLKDEQT